MASLLNTSFFDGVAAAVKAISEAMRKGEKPEEQYYSFVDNVSVLIPEGIDLGTRHVVSVRDGKLDYFGFEVGLGGEQATDSIPIYRTRETIEKLAPALIDIPIVEGGHLDTDYAVPEHVIVGYTRTAKIIEIEDPATESTCAVAHEAEMIKPVPGLPDLSLGYKAKIRPYRDGFEQYDIIPHHHAAVEAGRCGGICSFKDEKTQENAMLNSLLKNKSKQSGKNPAPGKPRQFNDEGAPTLEEIAGTIGNFAEAVKRVPLDENVMAVIAAMQAVIDGAGAGDGGGTPPPANQEGGDSDTPPAGEQEQKDEDKGAGNGDKGKEDEKPFADAKQFHDAVAKASQAEVQRYMKVVSKAQQFLPENYDYSSKTPNQIMKDTLASQGYKNFSDEKLPIAFEMLRRDADYKTFGDEGKDPLDAVKDKEI